MSIDREDQVSIMLDVLPDVVIFKDGQGRWLSANETALSVFGLLGVAYKGKRDSELGAHTAYYQDVLNYCETTDEDAWAAGQLLRVEETVPQEHGPARVFDVMKVPLFESDGQRRGLFIIGRDITEKLALSNQYRLIAQHMSDLIAIYQPNGDLTYLSPSHETILGMPADVSLKHQIFNAIVPEDRDRIRNWARQVVFARESTSIRFFCIDVHGRPRCFEAHPIPATDPQGTLLHIVIVTRDVTEQQETEEILRKSAMLQAVGEMAAGIAHEIRNPLTSVKGFLQWTHGTLSETQYALVMAELTRIEETIHHMLLLARPQATAHRLEDVTVLLTFVLQVMEAEFLLHGITVTLEISHAEIMVYCVANHIKQVFVNLIKNATDAMPAGGNLTISLAVEPEHNTVLIKVRDEGIGIEEERLKKLGEPFYTTKTKGNGLGLMMCYKIVQEHNGTIHVDSVVGKGTVVYIRLPIATAPRPSAFVN